MSLGEVRVPHCRYDQQTVTLAGRKARRDVLSPEIGSFPEPFRRRGLSPQSVSAQLRPGKHHRGSGWGETPHLPNEIPVTLHDRQSAAVTLRDAYPSPGLDLAATSLHRASQLIWKAP
jgi:hypothetical protein